MARVKRGVTQHRRHRSVVKAAKGHYSVRHTQYRRAKESVLHALMYAYAHRRLRKRDFRRLWILRVGAASSSQGLSYSHFMNGLKRAGIDLNRKVLSEMAVRDPDNFSQLVERARGALAA
jgi:large subunit ribosomal protein L20